MNYYSVIVGEVGTGKSSFINAILEYGKVNNINAILEVLGHQ